MIPFTISCSRSLARWLPVKLPSDAEIPVYVRDRFAPFYRDLFSQQVKREEMKAVFLEYAWNMAWCDPCAAEPLSQQELRQLGVFWLDRGADGRVAPGGGNDVFLTRLHVRYDRAHFPEDLVFQATGDQQNFQARYILRHPWKGSDDCEMAQRYRRELRDRQEREARTLASLTGWNLGEIRRELQLTAAPGREKSWWEGIWE